MSPLPLALLSLLRPVASQGARAEGAGAGKFSELLDLARKGAIDTDRPVEIARGAGVELSADQLRRLAFATDQAESQGASHALVLIDGMSLRVDVMTREVTGRVDISRPGVFAGIEAVVNAGSDAPAPPPLPRTRIENPQLRRLLAGLPTL